jgi:DNA-binding transcriptional LysR family regulator
VERDDYAVMAMVEQDLGVSLMPQLVLAGTARRIAAVPLDPPAWRDLGVAYGDGAQLSTAARAFLDCATRFVTEG